MDPFLTPDQLKHRIVAFYTAKSSASAVTTATTSAGITKSASVEHSVVSSSGRASQFEPSELLSVSVGPANTSSVSSDAFAHTATPLFPSSDEDNSDNGKELFIEEVLMPHCILLQVQHTKIWRQSCCSQLHP
jgi:hypothetical protein